MFAVTGAADARPRAAWSSVTGAGSRLGQVREEVELGRVVEGRGRGHGGGVGALQDPLDRNLQLLPGDGVRDPRGRDDLVGHMAGRGAFADLAPYPAAEFLVEVDAVGQHHEQRHPVAA